MRVVKERVVKERVVKERVVKERVAKEVVKGRSNSLDQPLTNSTQLKDNARH
jgi:hypothetical protein